MPGCLIAMGRVNRPALMVYGGTIKPGHRAVNGQDEKLDIVSAFQCYGEYLAGTIDEADRQEIVRQGLPRRGRLRRHVHGQHDGLGDRGDGHVAALQLVDCRPKIRGKLDECFAAGAAIRVCWSATSSRATS